MIRHVLPAYSPVNLGAIWAGSKAAVGMRSEAGRVIDRWVAERFSPRGYLLTDSGTSALRLAIRAAVEDSGGRPVALPAYTCFDVATAAEGSGARVLLYDINPRTLGPDFESLRSCLKGGAGTVVVAHLFGIPVDLGEVGATLRGHGALLIEDAAQGAGASYDGRPLGSFGSLSVLSFGRGKGRTGGGGGALLWLDERGGGLAEQLPSLPVAGRGAREVLTVSGQWAFGRPRWYALPSSIPALHLGETPHKEPAPVKAMPNAARTVLAVVLDLLEDEEATRRRNAERLWPIVAQQSGLRPIDCPDGGEAGFLRLPFLVARTDVRDALRSRSARRLGIMPGYPSRLVDLVRFRPFLLNAGDPMRGAADLVHGLLTLPTHSRLTLSDLERMRACLSRT